MKGNSRYVPGTKLPDKPVDYDALEQAYNEASWGTEEPNLVMIRPHICQGCGMTVYYVPWSGLSGLRPTVCSDDGKLTPHECKRKEGED